MSPDGQDPDSSRPGVRGPEVAVVATGTANLASVLAALRRAGAAPRLIADPEEVERAERLVLPGVGAFAAAMAELDRRSLTAALKERVLAGRPTLGICLGLQLLLDGSDEAEADGVRGLGRIPGRATRFPVDVRVPQFGWNRIDASPGCRVLQSGHAYFANSYRLVEPPVGWHVATADHGGSFVAAVERGRIVACQFHPELSGALGQSILSAWVDTARQEVSAC